MDYRTDNDQIERGARMAATDINATEPLSKEVRVTGEYAKGMVYFAEIPIMIENPADSIRAGDDWISRLNNHYGYIVGVNGADGDELDVYVGEYQYQQYATIVDQVVDGKFDESKVLLGFPDEEAAMGNYYLNFDINWDKQPIYTTVTIDRLKEWLKSGQTDKPFIEWYKEIEIDWTSL